MRVYLTAKYMVSVTLNSLSLTWSTSMMSVSTWTVVAVSVMGVSSLA